MWSYAPPLREMQFVIEDVLGLPQAWAEVPRHADLDAVTARQVLEEAGRFASEVIAPINSSADLEGCHWHDGAVRTPAGFAQAYRQYVEGGWPLLVCEPEDGGQGLPMVLQAAFDEMLTASNHGWTMYGGLLRGAYECLRAYGSDPLKARYLSKMASGEWLATMNLTEPQAGSDLGLLRTRAEPIGADADGERFRITGSKLFISGGDHDLTDNIVHLVLARLPDAPAGSRGISLFLVPKWLPDGSRNAVRCDGIEKKMGIRGSATCTMSYDGATGWLLGDPHRGLAAMFVMMNAARLHVGLQGLGHLEAAQQNARAYARERRQGGGRAIVEHPSVRRTLWRLRAQVEAGRVIAYWAAQLIDESRHHPDADRRARAADFVSLLTPVVKAGLTEQGHHGANDALQIWGGYGYVHEYGIEQAVRDSRIAMIYEGTNEIQAIDLLLRKVLDDGGRRLGSLLDAIERDLDAARDAEGEALAPFIAGLGSAVAGLRIVTATLVEGRAHDPEWALRIADDYRRGVGLVLSGWAWTRIAMAASRHAGEAWYDDRLRIARHGLQWLLPDVDGVWRRVMARESELAPLD